LVGVITAMLTALFFLRPSHVRDFFPTTLNGIDADGSHFLVPARYPQCQLIVPVTCATLLVLLLSFIGVWSAGKAARVAGIEDPQYVVIDEVAGQHITLILR